MLQGIIRSLIDHYGLDPDTYTMARVEKPPTSEEDKAEQPLLSPQLQTPKTPGLYSEDDEECQPEWKDYIRSPSSLPLGIPKIPGHYSDDEELE